MIINLEERHIDALEEAQERMNHCDFCPYLELKTLLRVTSPQAQERFRTLFTKFYGLNLGGLTDDFKKRYFEILFAGKVIANGHPDFSSILHELSLIPRKKGDFAMPFSFVSKLVAIHDESSPIYDEHVRNFFREKASTAEKPKPDRIIWFAGFLKQVATDYAAWAKDERVTPILDKLKTRDQRLNHCNPIRLMDFLVWKVGNQKLL